MLLSMAAAALMMQLYGAPDNQAARQVATLRDMAGAREALLGFAAQHGRLPRPAISAVDGREGADCGNATPCSGFLPWTALGLPPGDRWNKLLRYSVAPALTVRPVTAALAVADRRILGRDLRGLLQITAGQAQCSVDHPCLAALLLSSGARNLGTSIQGRPQGNSTTNNIDEQYNDHATNDFIQGRLQVSDTARSGEFDDLVLGLELQPLYQRMNASGMLQ